MFIVVVGRELVIVKSNRSALILNLVNQESQGALEDQIKTGDIETNNDADRNHERGHGAGGFE